jgi:hypothetical protein
MNARRRWRTAYKIAVIVANALTHWTEVLWRTTSMVVLRATMITTVVIVLALWAAVVVIVALIGAGVQQRGRTEHQHAQAGYQTFRHFHWGFLTAQTAKRDSEPDSESLGLAT